MDEHAGHPVIQTAHRSQSGLPAEHQLRLPMPALLSFAILLQLAGPWWHPCQPQPLQHQLLPEHEPRLCLCLDQHLNSTATECSILLQVSIDAGRGEGACVQHLHHLVMHQQYMFEKELHKAYRPPVLLCLSASALQHGVALQTPCRHCLRMLAVGQQIHRPD